MSILLDTTFLSPLRLTLQVASVATLISLVAGIAAAYILKRYEFPGRNILDAVLTLPLVLPPTVLGYYLLVLIGRRGVIGQFLQEQFGIQLMFTLKGAVIAAAVVSFPLVFKSARAALEGVSGNLENAARTLGCSEISVFLRVSLPLALRGIVAGAMLAFARAMGEFGATLMVAGNLPGKTQTMSLAVYSAVQAGRDDLANTLVLAISIVCVAILFITSKLVKPT
ncbi:molybdate ABC transporter permease subunit [Oceanidesulfovibrio indonesiensis]|uniref:Molybdenum transport system permease n=1 Tax=Oceanidesulfovibrio indonesiensis TaxID=54767 RepID=A0A7M3MIK8_9BACT|nr:molybdate ABC transporter permease subunit [Oceanidesulfovibrio indonesiensis]TVM19513.1 molybdate ABC transporter permease subunit [Oceanidesulfovibrio indonesiensis]